MRAASAPAPARRAGWRQQPVGQGGGGGQPAQAPADVGAGGASPGARRTNRLSFPQRWQARASSSGLYCPRCQPRLYSWRRQRLELHRGRLPSAKNQVPNPM
ncbi:MAG: hypothetical protein WKG07_38515 [Hymenobacter sp.]